jgi:hypothetical protein
MPSPIAVGSLICIRGCGHIVHAGAIHAHVRSSYESARRTIGEVGSNRKRALAIFKVPWWSMTGHGRCGDRVNPMIS